MKSKLIILLCCFVSIFCASLFDNKDIVVKANNDTTIQIQENENINSQTIMPYVVSEEESNLLCYDYDTGTTEYLYFDNSIWEASLNSLIDTNPVSTMSTTSPSGILEVSDPTIAPYKYVSILTQSPITSTNIVSYYGTAFFIGPNILLTAGHCIHDNNDFRSNIYVTPGFDKDVNFYSSIPAKKVYILKEYQNQRRLEAANDFTDNVHNSWYDWAVLVVEKSTELTNWLGGNFGKIANYSTTNVDATIIGYPQTDKSEMCYSSGTISSYSNIYEKSDDIEFETDLQIKYNIISTGGFSGSPVVINYNGYPYAIGIHVTGYTAVRINSFIYLLTNSLLADKGIEVRDYYNLNDSDDYDAFVKYNCVVKYIITPKENETIYVSSNGTSFPQSFSSNTIRYYPTGSNTIVGQLEYNYFKVYNASIQSYSSVYNIANLYSTDERSANYATVGKTTYGNVIYTSYDQTSNVWEHSGSSSQYVKGTIVYNGVARNIECNIPILGYKYSEDVTINGVTFTLRCGPNKVSIKASSPIMCNNYLTMFAFGVG